MVAEAAAEAAAAAADAAGAPEAPELQTEGDLVRLTVPEGREVHASKAALASRTAFFSPLAEESGETTYGEAELSHLAGALAPGARKALPDILEVVGSQGPPRWQKLFSREGVFHAFAAGHLLGVPELLEAARTWAAADGRRLSMALLALDCRADGASLRTCADYGLDRHSSLKLLHAAATVDAAGAAEVLVAEGDAPDLPAEPPVDVRDQRGHTALHVCAAHDSAAVAAVLIHASAAVDSLCDPPGENGDEENDDSVAPGDGESAGVDQVDVAMGRQPLRERAATAGVKTALHLAALHDSPDVAQVLLEAKADVAACVKGAEGAVTPLHECANADSARAARVLAAAAAAASEANLQRLLAPQREPLAERSVGDNTSAGGGAAGDTGEPAKAVAEGPDDSQGGDAVVQWARYLDPLNAKVGLNGSTPLHMAAENDAPGVAEALLEAKADMSAGDEQGDSPLHCAVLYGSPGALAKLLAHGSNAVQENCGGELPLHLLAEFGPGESGEELPPSMAKRHFMKSIKAQRVLVDALRSSGKLQQSVAHAAAGDNGNTPLHAVARWNHLGAENAARLLAEARADLERRNGEGTTPLAVALRRYGGEGRVVAVLRGLGAKEPPPEDVDPLAGALGGCVRPLLWPLPGAGGVGGSAAPRPVPTGAEPAPASPPEAQPSPAESTPSGAPEPLLPLQATQAAEATQATGATQDVQVER